MARDYANYDYVYSVEVGLNFAVSKHPHEGMIAEDGVRYSMEEIELLLPHKLTKQVHLVKKEFNGEIIGPSPLSQSLDYRTLETIFERRRYSGK